MEELPSGPSGGSNAGSEGNGSLLQLVHDHCGPCPAGSPQFMHLEVKCFIKTAMTQCRINIIQVVRPKLSQISMIVSIVTTILVQGNIKMSSMGPDLPPGTNVSGQDEGCSHQESKDDEEDQVIRHT